MTPVSDPAILAQLNGSSGLKPVTDPAILAQLNGTEDSAPEQPQDQGLIGALEHQPGWTYGGVLPLARDPQGKLHLALPEMIREPILSALKSGEMAAHGQVPQVSDYMPAVLATVGSGIKAPAAAGGEAPSIIQAMTPKSTTAEQKAGALVSRAFTRDKIAPENAGQVMSRYPDKDIAVMDVGGKNVQRLARTVNTLPGEGSEQVGKFLAERQADQHNRVVSDITSNLADGSDVYQTVDSLNAQRATDSAPLYDKAFAGGSIAPLQDQLRSELQSATAAKGTIAKQMKAIEDNNPGALAARGAAGLDTRARYMDLNKQLQQAESDRQAVLEKFRQAQSDAASNAPGAVWTPRIQQFLDDPIIKQGIRQGLEVQRLEALAKGVPFNPTEYAITGVDESGQPIVGNVPNMRLLDAAKRGLDSILEGYRDPVTGKVTLDQRGRAIDAVRKSLIGELDNLNPDYKAARQAYAGPSQGMDAISRGQSFMDLPPERLTKLMSQMPDDQKSYYLIGAGRKLQDMVNGAADNRDAVAKVFGNKTIRAQIEAVFGKNQAAKFAEAMSAENAATATNRVVRGGSNTADKLADVEDAGAKLKMDALKGFVAGGVKGAMAVPAVSFITRKGYERFTGLSPEVRNALADILTRTNPETLNALSRPNLPPSGINYGADNRASAIAAQALNALLMPPPDANGQGR